MTLIQKILLHIAMLRRRPTSSRPVPPQIFPTYDTGLTRIGQNRTTATSSHVVPTSSHAGGRPQQRGRPSAPPLTGGTTSPRRPKHHTPTSPRDDLRDDLKTDMRR